MRVFVERFDRGEWNQAFIDRTYQDLCLSFKNPLDPMYLHLSQIGHECPFPVGYVKNFDHGKILQIPSGFPDNAEGKYRLTVEFTTITGSEKRGECIQCMADLVRL